MSGTGLSVTVRVEGGWQTVAAFRRLPHDADQALRDASARIAFALAGRIQAAARSEGRQAALLAGTVRVRRDRLPTVVAGGSARVGSRGTPAWHLLFGSEFGSDTYRQFRPSADSYWFFRTVSAEQDLMGRQWREAADEVLDAFTAGG